MDDHDAIEQLRQEVRRLNRRVAFLCQEYTQAKITVPAIRTS